MLHLNKVYLFIYLLCMVLYVQLKNCSHHNNAFHYEFMIRSECWAESFTGYLNTWMWCGTRLNHRVQHCHCHSQRYLKDG